MRICGAARTGTRFVLPQERGGAPPLKPEDREVAPAHKVFSEDIDLGLSGMQKDAADTGTPEEDSSSSSPGDSDSSESASSSNTPESEHVGPTDILRPLYLVN